MSRLIPIFSLPSLALTIIIVSLSSSCALSEWRSSQPEWRSSQEEFVDALKKATKAVKQANSELKDWQKEYHSGSDEDVSNEIQKCKYLLQNSGKALKCSLDAVQDHNDYYNADDVASYLNAVEYYEELCYEGFRTNREAQNKAKQILDDSFLLVRDLLGMVHGSHWNRGGRSDDGWIDDYDPVSRRSAWKKQPKRTSKCVFSSLERNHERSVLDEQSANAAVVHARADVTVAKDGSGKYRTIMEAVNAAPSGSKTPFVIHIKKGVYDEKVEISVAKTNLVMIGDGMKDTLITGSRSFARGIEAPNTATFAVLADRFVAKHLTIQNTSGPNGHAAVALLASGDQVAFYNCGFSGYENTILLTAKRQFFKECTIRGTKDIITGSATAVFQNSTILVRKGSSDDQQPRNYITAHGVKARRGRSDPAGFSFQFCKILSEEPIPERVKTFLGRPSNAHSRVLFMQTYISSVVNREGWSEWSGTLNLDTLYYAEYRNSGPGANTSGRVKWRNYHPNISRFDAMKFTVSKLIKGDAWLPFLDVPFIAVGL